MYYGYIITQTVYVGVTNESETTLESRTHEPTMNELGYPIMIRSWVMAAFRTPMPKPRWNNGQRSSEYSNVYKTTSTARF